MRNGLWPSSMEEHLEEIGKYFANGEIDIVEVFVHDRGNGKLGGFIELNLRNWVEGSKSSNIPYIEGWYVDEDLRGMGYGKQLIQAAEEWAVGNGFNELASDAQIENLHSIAIHKVLGFEEVERIVCFIKRLS